MKQRVDKARILVGMALILAAVGVAGASRAAEDVFSLTKQITPTIGQIWSIPVYDGTNIVISSENEGTLVAAKYDLALAGQVGSTVTVADTSDTNGGDSIADHKHIFQNGSHYLAFSTSGDGSGGYLYLVKLNSSLARQKIVTVVSNDAPTNDMVLVGDGTNIHVGKFLPGIGHRIYSYDANLTSLGDPVDIGGGLNTHSNGAALLYAGGYFHLVAPYTLGAGMNGTYSHIVFNSDWSVAEDKEIILESLANDLSLVTGLVQDTASGRFFVFYTRATTDDGGPVYAAVYNASWNLQSDEEILDGNWHRPHGLLANNALYLGYDNGFYNSVPEIGLASFQYTSAPQVYISHLTGTENLWTDILAVDNLSSSAASYTVTLFDEEGDQILQESYNIAANDYVNHDLSELGPGGATGRVSTSDTSLNFRISYDHVNGGVAEFPLHDETYDKVGFLFANHQASFTWKGLALQNTGTNDLSVTLYALGSGAVLATATDTIPAGTRIVGLHTKWFPSVSLAAIEKIVVTASEAVLQGITISGDSSGTRLLSTPAVDASAFSAP